ncbi:MAG TPA: hypothetical protein VMG38_06320 [Trebonia sp.]|nr:hypothetical protein [Trebonia sp.]
MIRIIGARKLAALRAEAARVPGLLQAVTQAEEAMQRAIARVEEAGRIAAAAQADAGRALQAAPAAEPGLPAPGPAGSAPPAMSTQVVPAHGVAYFGPDGDNAGGTPYYPDVYRATCLCGWTQAGDGLSMILALAGHNNTAPELELPAHVVTFWAPESGGPGEAHQATCLCGWAADGDAETVSPASRSTGPAPAAKR